MPPFASLILRAFAPALPHPHPREALRAAVGGMLGLLFAQFILWGIGHLSGASLAGLLAHPLLIAPFGASAVLIYAVPSSPLAQPWSVVAGNTVSGLCAIAALHLGLPPMVALCLAVLLALVAMAFARALHPPGGAVAVATVLASTPDQIPGLSYLLITVLLGSLLLVIFGVAYNRATGRTYPFRTTAQVPAPVAPLPETRQLPSPLVLASALDRTRLGANIGVEDVARLIEAAEEIAAGHALGLVAGSIMTADPITVGPDADWRTLSAMFVDHGFRNLLVVSGENRFMGLIPVQTILRPGAQGLSARHLLQEVVTRPPEASLADLLPALAQGHQTALPIVNDDGSLAGLVTRSDIVAALVHRMAHD
ncbi:MAG: HPP family protein [Cypionkella sp.]